MLRAPLRPVAGRARPRRPVPSTSAASPWRSSSRTSPASVIGIRAGEDEITAEVVILCRRRELHARRAMPWATPRPKAIPDGRGRQGGLRAARRRSSRTASMRTRGRGRCHGCSWATATHGIVRRRLHVHQQGVHLARPGGHHLPGRRRQAATSPGLPDARGLQEPPGRWRPCIRGAKMVEHSGHMVPEGGYQHDARATSVDGCHDRRRHRRPCASTSATRCAAWTSPWRRASMAAEAAVAAIDAGDTSAAGLAPYKEAMEGSFVIQDLRTFSKWPHVMEEWSTACSPTTR